MVICNMCGRDIDAISQDNVSYGSNPICEDCAAKQQNWLYADGEEVIDFDYGGENE